MSAVKTGNIRARLRKRSMSKRARSPRNPATQSRRSRFVRGIRVLPLARLDRSLHECMLQERLEQSPDDCHDIRRCRHWIGSCHALGSWSWGCRRSMCNGSGECGQYEGKVKSTGELDVLLAINALLHKTSYMSICVLGE